MASSIALEVIISDKNYRKITTNTFKRYTDEDFENLLLKEFIKMNFKN